MKTKYVIQILFAVFFIKLLRKKSHLVSYGNLCFSLENPFDKTFHTAVPLIGLLGFCFF